MALRFPPHSMALGLAEEHHAESVDADADAAGGRHTVFEGDQEVFVQFKLVKAYSAKA